MTTKKAGEEALWITRFLAALRYSLPGQPVDLKADNRGAVQLTANPEFHHRTKHIEVRHHWTHENVDSRQIVIGYVSTEDMVADGLTRPLNINALSYFGQPEDILIAQVTHSPMPGLNGYRGNRIDSVFF